jgi:ribonuclease D
MSLPFEFQRTVSREEINELPIRRYEGEVCLVAAPQDLERARADLRQETVVGFDTEKRPTFRVGEHYPPSLAQAATARAVYLFPLARLDCSAALAPLLADPKVVKTGVGLAEDLRELKKIMEFDQKAVIDLGTVAKRHGVGKTGVRTLAGLFLGFRVPKGTKTSNWAAPRLSAQQIAYAATDAWACRELYLRFKELGMI